MQFFDDATFVAKVEPKRDLIMDPKVRERPLTYEESCQLVIKSESNVLQKCINNFKHFTEKNKIKSVK